ncbi:MAG: glycosyl hydrolase 53 family protein [Clostridia bacterium]|nr:extra-cellular endo-beta-1,4-galactanase [Clostridiales bacterium]MBQ6715750.1 glycosyl hydrolase 53 family protein [Clostridia bacterium]
MKYLILVLLCALFFNCLPALSEGESSLYVRKIENLPEDFIFGMDASSVIALEDSGVKYYDFEGNEEDVFKVLAESGVTHIRVRIWNHPYNMAGKGYGGGNSDIEKAVLIGQRATKHGMKLIANFHYSDFWADPGKQMVPVAWAGMEIEEKTEALYNYTRDCLLKLKDAGVDVGMVQVGNETNGRMCGEKTWFNIQYLMQAGAKATREVFPDALVALHFANPEKAGSYETYASKMDYYKVDYDVFASSYYPYWHGSLENLTEVLTKIADTYGKKVMVMETSYAYTAEDTDFYGNTISDGGAIIKSYPFTVQGQANNVIDITDAIVNKTPSGIGVVYWEGTWISVGTESWEKNNEIWERYGSGWATSYAKTYDANDAGKYFGGNAVDNQAMFDASGHPLESLKVFKLMREGNEIAPAPDALEDVNLICDLNAPLSLPETVNAVMTDNTKQSIDVVWNLTDEMDEKMHASGPSQYVIEGEAGGMTARAYVSMVEYNYLTDYSFEEGGKNWVFTDLNKADELFIEDKKTDSLTGTKHAHFWSAKKNSVEFTLEQTLSDLPEGKYALTASIMGGDAGKTDIYCYVRMGDEIVASAPMTITFYGNWCTAKTNAIEYHGGDTITVGVYVKCEGAGNGAWGKIDDLMLNSVK